MNHEFITWTAEAMCRYDGSNICASNPVEQMCCLRTTCQPCCGLDPPRHLPVSLLLLRRSRRVRGGAVYSPLQVGAGPIRAQCDRSEHLNASIVFIAPLKKLLLAPQTSNVNTQKKTILSDVTQALPWLRHSESLDCLLPSSDYPCALYYYQVGLSLGERNFTRAAEGRNSASRELEHYIRLG